MHLLLETPIAMLVSDAPALHVWFNASFSDPEPSEWPKEVSAVEESDVEAEVAAELDIEG